MKSKLYQFIFNLKHHSNAAAQLLFLFGIVFSISAASYKLLYLIFAAKSSHIINGLLPGYLSTNSGSPFKREILILVLIQVILFVFIFVTTYFSRLIKIRALLQKCFKLTPLLLYILLVLIFFLRDWAIRYLLLASLVCIFTSWLLQASAAEEKYFESVLSKVICFKSCLINLYQKLIKLKEYSYSRSLLTAFCLLVLIAPGIYAWQGLTLPNDYYEVQESYLFNDVSSSGGYIKRSEVENYLDKNNLTNSNQPQYQRLYRQYFGSRNWSTETGRILYHHSYIYLPAIHLLQYGFDKNIPYLYGYGNTTLHATFISLFGGNLSAYFYSYPFVILLGIFVIAAVVRYGAITKISFLLAFAICLWQIYAVGFGVALLAASFSPARYVGLAIQVLSIFYCFRKKSLLSFYAISLAFTFSLAWNFEFAIIGLAGQLVALILPKRQESSKSSLRKRVINLMLILIFIFGYLFLAKTSEDILTSISLGFFQINMPVLGSIDSIIIITGILCAQLVLFFLTFLFKDGERSARLCILPILGLLMLKYLWNPAAPHLHITLAFILPMCLLYIPFSLISSATMLSSTSILIRKNYLLNGVSIVILAICLIQSYQYVSESIYVKKYVVGDFLAMPWKSLGESIPMVTPEAQILQRVESIKKNLHPADSLLILSPFDHLLSFYINPKKYCGHFDLITNLTSQGDYERIKKCVDKNSELLIVYDEALLTACPDRIDPKASLENCSNKLVFKTNVSNILKHIPNLKEIGRDGDLIFFRSISTSHPKFGL